MTWYNENDRYAAQWLRNLMAAGEIAEGTVDERSVRDIAATDLAGVRRAHFFAGIAGWDLALRLAGWPNEREVWTGSCPCQPFSVAGKRKGAADDRHLWPAWFRLIRERRPQCIFGEQVASAIGHGWLDGVFADLEGEGYACGAVVLGAHSVGAPHIRQRVFWVAHTEHAKRREIHINGRDGRDGKNEGRAETYGEPRTCGEVRGLAYPDGGEPCNRELQRSGRLVQQPQDKAAGGLADAEGRTTRPGQPVRSWESDARQGGRLGDSDAKGLPQRPQSEGRSAVGDQGQTAGTSSPVVRTWADFDILPCLDGKARRTQPGIFPLAHGVPGRVGLLRGAGNAIVPQAAAAFVRAFMEMEDAR